MRKPQALKKYEIEMWQDLLSPYSPSEERKEMRKQTWARLFPNSQAEDHPYHLVRKSS
jgi:hypothetical protein